MAMIIVHSKDWDDLPQNAGEDDKNKPAEASMLSVAYAGNNRDSIPEHGDSK
jgi:hypothetical protein